MKIDIGIPEKNRKEVASGLVRLLADSYTLYLKTHNYHWNVTGPMFNTLHAMFELHYTELATAVDVIAERIRTLGEFVPASYSEFSDATSVSPANKAPSPALEMVQDLVKGHEAVARTARSLYPAVEQAADEATADLLTQRIQLHEKTAWMLRVILES